MKTLASESGGPGSIPLAVQKFFFSYFTLIFFFFFFFLHVYFNFLSVLSALTLQENRYYLPFSNNKSSNTDPRRMQRSLQFADKFIVSDVCELAELHQPSSSPIPCLVPCLRVTLLFFVFFFNILFTTLTTLIEYLHKYVPTYTYRYLQSRLTLHYIFSFLETKITRKKKTLLQYSSNNKLINYR